MLGLSALLQSRRRLDEARLAHVLRGVPLFRDAPRADLVAVWRRLAEARLPAGAVICRRGDPGDRFYLIQAGAVEVRLGLGRAGVPLRRLGPGDFFGEMALLTGEPRSADVVAAEDVVLWTLERVDFEAVLAASMPFLRALNRALCERVAALTRALDERDAAEAPAGLRFGPYRVVEQLGVGGMAVVYSAVHAATDTAVAIKVLPAGWGAAPELRERLRREAEGLGRVSHPNVIRLLEVGEVEARFGGGSYLAMEWLPHALDRLLRAQYPDPLPVAMALRIGRGVAEGLAAVHAEGLVHRDVKPSNILLRTDGTPVLTDFGLATALAEAARVHQLTPANVVVGTPDYLSPEHIAGLPLDGRSDLYSLGVVLYELLTGYAPFAGLEPLETFRAHVEAPPPPLPPSLPAPTRTVVERALQKRPTDRFTSAAEMVSALEAAQVQV